MKASSSINAALGSTPAKHQSLTLNNNTCDGVEIKADSDSNTTDVAPVKRSYPVIDRRALRFAQFYASMQESQWSYQSAVHYLKLAYGFASEPPAPAMPVNEASHA